LEACDRVRDETMVNLGVRLEDRPTGKSVWKLDDPEVLKAEMAEKERLATEIQEKKLRNKLQLKLNERERFDKAFELPSKYSEYDAVSGYPTHDKDGKLLEGKAVDNAKKDFDKFLKRKGVMEKKLEDNPEYLNELDREIEELRKALGEGG